MPNRVRLSHKIIEELPTPANSREHCYDSLTPNLAVCVTPSGRRIFYWIGRTPAGPSRLMIGRFPDMTLEKARTESKRLTADAAEGKVPRTSRRMARSAWTLGKVFAHFLENYSKPHKKTWERDQRQFDRTLADWRHYSLESISRAMVRERHVSLAADHGPCGGNKMLELLNSLYNYAIDELDWIGKNPARKIKRFKVNERERFLEADELPRFFAAVAKLQREVSRDFFMLCLFVGARRSNICSMRWADVNLDRCQWRIAGEDHKSGESAVIVLSEPAIEILRRRKETAKSEWVLEGQGKTGHYAYPKAAWKKILRDSGLTDLRIHDLRRTLGSWQAMGGSSLLIIGKSLGHKSTQATKVYARLQTDPVMESVQAAADAMLGSAHQKSNSRKNAASSLSSPSPSLSSPSQSSAKSRKRPKR